MTQTPEQIAATSQEILNCIEVAGGRVDPGELIKLMEVGDAD